MKQNCRHTLKYKSYLSLICAFLFVFFLLPRAAPFRYLAIGNSITWLPVSDSWWIESGMAASAPEKDYVHLVTDYLNTQHDSVETSICLLVAWEVQSGDRSETLPMLDPFLDPQPDLITLQISENAKLDRRFSKDYTALVRYIKEKCPHADIILVDDFWSDIKSVIKEKAARKLHLPFASLKLIRNDPAYQSALGAVIYDSEGAAHEIDSHAVAIHPGDPGMAFIANVIIQQLEKMK